MPQTSDPVDSGAPNTAKQVVAALIVRDGTVLICQRKADQPMALKWEFPGGKIELGESCEEALARELQEELGIDAEIGAKITRVYHPYRNGGAVELHFYIVKNFRGELENKIFNAMRWELLSDLPKFDFLAADHNLVRELAAGKLL